MLGEAVTTIAAGHGWTYPKTRHVMDITSTPAVTLTHRERQIGTLYAESLAGTSRRQVTDCAGRLGLGSQTGFTRAAHLHTPRAAPNFEHTTVPHREQKPREGG